MQNPVGWFEIYVDDIQRAKKFYEGVFQTELTHMESPEVQMWAFPMDMNQFGASGTIVHMPGFTAGRNSVLVYFSCEDCAVEESRITQFGGSIEKTKLSIGEYGFITLGYDTEGNMIGLHSIK